MPLLGYFQAASFIGGGSWIFLGKSMSQSGDNLSTKVMDTNFKIYKLYVCQTKLFTAPEITPSFLVGFVLFILQFSMLCYVCCCLFVFYFQPWHCPFVLDLSQFDCPFGIFHPSFRIVWSFYCLYIYFECLLHYCHIFLKKNITDKNFMELLWSKSSYTEHF